MAHANRSWAGLTVGLLVLAAAGPARAACDVAANAAALSDARTAIDAACPCASAVSRGLYRRCASDVVKARVAALQLSVECNREALRHAKQSICGRPGTVVCCRTRIAGGRTRHRIARTAAACVPTSTYTACVSPWQSIPTGCDDAGCISPAVCGNGIVEQGETCDPPDGTSCDPTCHTIQAAVCGNSVVEAGEGCDPPDYLACDASCQPITCEPPPTTCGNGTVDVGETCEPPGVGACGRDCQAAPCAGPHLGEIDVACVDGGTNVAAAGTPAGYLLVWGGWHEIAAPQMLARRVDADGAPVDDTVSVLSDGAPCGSAHADPSVASDGADYYALWFATGGFGPPFDGAFYETMFGRSVAGTSGLGALDQYGMNIPVGSCRTDVLGPTMAAGVAPSRFALGWRSAGTCLGSIMFQDPTGFILDLRPPRTSMGAGLGFGFPTGFPAVGSSSAASVASLGGDTLWVWFAAYAESPSGPFIYFIAHVWSGAGGNTSPAILSARAPVSIGRPRVAAGNDGLLVTWAQAADETSGAKQIRGLRATRASGNIDPDGGLLLATTTGPVMGGPDVAFDGSRWLVVWSEAAGTINELRAVAVEQDGAVVDATPRLVATDVVSNEPAAASASDGRVLVLYGRADGLQRAIRATIVTP
jgi:hypothetical protein